jgi:hypothetical protein
MYVFIYYHWVDASAGRLLGLLNRVIIITYKVLIPRAYVTLVDFGYPVYALLFLLPKTFTNILALGVPDEGYHRKTSCVLNLISMFLLDIMDVWYMGH